MDNQHAREKNDITVSFDSEELILVDHNDNEIGHSSKDECHSGDGLLHRAFSLFIFNPIGELLLQQRSAQKRLWPLYWSNTCCSHPRRGETVEQAVSRRLHEELGLASDLHFLYKFIYQANYEDKGAEHEYCWVYTGKSADTVRPNTNEVAGWRFVRPDSLDRELADRSPDFTPWLKMEWKRLRNDFKDRVAAL